MNIADLRTKYPGFSDDEIIGALQRVKYPDYSTDEVAKVVGYEKPSEFGKGFKRSFAEVPGMAAGVVAYGADLVGADDTRDSLLGYAARRQQQVERDYGSEAASFTSVTEGKASPIDFLANASGYVIGQGLQAITTGGLTALGFKAMAKGAALEAAKVATEKSIATGAAKLAVEDAAKKGVTLTLEEAAKKIGMDAAETVLTKSALTGATAGAGAQNLGMELGSIYPEAVDEAKRQGRELTGEDKIRVGFSSLAAAAVDTAMERFTGMKMLNGSAGSTLTGRMARQVPAGMARESITEGIQTGIEHYGAGTPIADEKGVRDIIDSMAVGAVGGGLAGGVASLHKAQQQRADDGLAKIAEASTLDDAISGAMDAVSVPLLPAPSVTVDAAGVASTAEQRFSNLVGEQAARDERGGIVETGAMGQGRNSESAFVPADMALDTERANLSRWMERATPYPLDYANELKQRAASERGLDTTVVPHFDGSGYTVVPSKWVTPETRQRTYTEQTPVPARAERTGSSQAVEIDPAGPNAVAQFIAKQQATNTPATRAFVQDYKAGRISDADVMARLVPKTGEDPNARIAAAAAQAPKGDDGLLLTKDGFPYGTKASAQARVSREGGGSIIEVPGGYAVRPEGVAAPAPELASPAGMAAGPADVASDNSGGSSGDIRPGNDGIAASAGSAGSPLPGGMAAAPVADGNPANGSLTVGGTFELDGKGWTVTDVTPTAIKASEPGGGKKMIAVGSKVWQKIAGPQAIAPEAAAPAGTKVSRSGQGAEHQPAPAAPRAFPTEKLAKLVEMSGRSREDTSGMYLALVAKHGHDQAEKMLDAALKAADARQSRGPAASEAWKNEGKTPADLAVEKANNLGAELASQIAEEATQSDFAPTDLPKAVASWAKDNQVAADDLRQGVLKALDKLDISDGRKRQVLKALNPTASPDQVPESKPAEPTEAKPEAAPAPEQVPDPKTAEAEKPAAAKPEQTAKLVELRKRESILKAIKECLSK